MRGVSVLAAALLVLCCVRACDLELGREYPAYGEQDAIDRVIEIIKGHQEMQDAAEETVTRYFHAKGHGCVAASVQVNADIPAKWQYGVFSQPGKTYDARIRFSNGQTTISKDISPDTRGFALKLLDVEGERIPGDDHDSTTQDFVGAAFETFFFPDIATLADGTEALFTGSGVSGALKKAVFLAANPRTAHAIISMGVQGLTVKNPLSGQYWSQTPYRFGPASSRAVKWTAIPCADLPTPSLLDLTDPDYMLKAVDLTLNVESLPGCFDIAFQEQEDACEQPIEDSMEKWTTPWTKVARVTVPANQPVSTKEALEKCEQMEFNPWHGLKAHTPLGVNRARQQIYKYSSEHRHKLNGKPIFQPSGHSDL